MYIRASAVKMIHMTTFVSSFAEQCTKETIVDLSADGKAFRIKYRMSKLILSYIIRICPKALFRITGHIIDTFVILLTSLYFISLIVYRLLYLF